MKKQRILSRILPLLLVAVVLAILALPALASDNYQKMIPPPDADKPADDSRSNTCWLATAANMLAGAGYGDGVNVQERAEDIYNELFAHFGNVGGWTDTAITYWLWSPNNTFKGFNPYTVVTVYGNKSPPYPFDSPYLPQFIGNELRCCDMVGLSISWPGGGHGHAITAWGDSVTDDFLTTNPAQVIVTDSSKDTRGDVQTYAYDAYDSPNPGGPNEGNGWYINYGPNHPYIKHIITLCPINYPFHEPTHYPFHGPTPQTVVGSLIIHQSGYRDAIDLHYKVGADTDILTYRTTIDWETDEPPTIVESVEPYLHWDRFHWLTVDWDLSDHPVPYRTNVIITTELVLPLWNEIYYYEDQSFTYTYPMEPGPSLPAFGWEIYTPELDDTNVPDICGGYVIGSFDLFDLTGQNLIGEYRFLHEYDYFQDPELHYFSLMATGEEQVVEALVGNLRFGHSYGFLDADLLWEFEDWMLSDPEIYSLDPYYPIEVMLDWEGLLPYPAGDGPPIPTPKYNLTVGSTAGGSVTTPGEGTFTYDGGTVVNLVAQAEEGYYFVNWTGDVDTIDNLNCVSTTITMEGNYEITANFWEGEPCFIATAAYGTPMAEEIEILREFRDEYLLTNPLGQALTGLYYRVSPPIAEFITEHPSLKPIVRVGLLPAVAMSTVAVNTSPAGKMAIVGLLVLVSVALAAWATRWRGKGTQYT